MRMQTLLMEATQKRNITALKIAKAHLFNATYAFRRAHNAVLRNDVAGLMNDVETACKEIETAKGELSRITTLPTTLNQVKKCLNVACKELKALKKDLSNGEVNVDGLKCANDKFDESFNLLFTFELKLLSETGK